MAAADNLAGQDRRRAAGRAALIARGGARVDSGRMDREPPFELTAAARAGRCYLVGAGPGDPRLVTVRGAELIASSVTLVTAVKRDGSDFDWHELAQVRGTVCVLMGVRRLDRICRALVEQAGRAPETPAAVVRWASLPTQQTVTGSLADIAARA